MIAILHAFNPLAAPVSNLVGWGLPAYLSFKALESPSPNDDVQWLTYWVVFGFFNFLESFAVRVLLYYLPWYYAVKTVFIIWLQLPAFRVSSPNSERVACLISLTISLRCPRFQGAQTTYFTLLKPVLSNVSGQSRVVAPTTTTADHHE